MTTIAAVFTLLTAVAFVFAFWKMKQGEKEAPTVRSRARAAGERTGRDR